MKRKKLQEEKEAIKKKLGIDKSMNDADINYFMRRQSALLPDTEKFFEMEEDLEPPQEVKQTWKDAFKVSIEWQVYITGSAPNVHLFERTLKKIEKICISHPDELFTVEDNTWQ